MGAVKSTDQHIIAIGGIGGSGTRLIADIVMRLGFYMGSSLNPALDNLWFTLLFQRPSWFDRFPSDSEIAGAIELFRQAMTTGLASGISNSQASYIRDVVHDLERAERGTGADSTIAEQLLASTPPDFANHVGWGWKEPNTHIFLSQIASALPGLMYIHVIRHGLDMAFSKNKYQLLNWGHFICKFSYRDKFTSPSRALDYWIAANRRAIKIGENQLHDKFLVVNYDLLCTQTEVELDNIICFLNLTPHSDLVEYLRNMISAEHNNRYKHHNIGMFSELQLKIVREFGFEINNV